MNGYGRTKTFDAIAMELCRRVGLSYPPPPGVKYEVDAATWTREDEADFKKWLIDYLKTVPMFKGMGRRYTLKEADWFIFQYSWKYKGGEDV